jgi:hypothetical protein
MHWVSEGVVILRETTATRASASIPSMLTT